MSRRDDLERAYASTASWSVRMDSRGKIFRFDVPADWTDEQRQLLEEAVDAANARIEAEVGA